MRRSVGWLHVAGGVFRARVSRRARAPSPASIRPSPVRACRWIAWDHRARRRVNLGKSPAKPPAAALAGGHLVFGSKVHCASGYDTGLPRHRRSGPVREIPFPFLAIELADRARRSAAQAGTIARRSHRAARAADAGRSALIHVDRPKRSFGRTTVMAREAQSAREVEMVSRADDGGLEPRRIVETSRVRIDRAG